MSPESCEILLFGGPLHGQRMAVPAAPPKLRFPARRGTVSYDRLTVDEVAPFGEIAYERHELADVPGAIAYLYLGGGDDAH